MFLFILYSRVVLALGFVAYSSVFSLMDGSECVVARARSVQRAVLIRADIYNSRLQARAHCIVMEIFHFRSCIVPQPQQ